jgi:TRAP transporter TAXI family solute receptor
VTFGTAGTSGAFYVISAAIAREAAKNSPLNIVVQATSGGGENIGMVNGGEMNFGWGNTGTIYNNYHGTSYVKPEDRTENIRSVMALHIAYGQMMTRKDSGIKTFGDLKGKRVCLGTTGPDTYNMSMAVIRQYGIDPEKDLTGYYLTQDEGAQKLGDNDIDATFITAGIPTAVFTNLATDGKYTLVDADPKYLENVSKGDMPYAVPSVIKAGTYPNIDVDINALCSRSEIFCGINVPDEVVYEFCKLVFDNWDAIKTSHSVLADLDPATFSRTAIDLHPGAEKYYREIGLIKD